MFVILMSLNLCLLGFSTDKNKFDYICEKYLVFYIPVLSLGPVERKVSVNSYKYFVYL
jgi:hypothetical protein